MAASIGKATERIEMEDFTEHRADPEARFHYRYQAAFLALEAANLMPDNADETAVVLCTAGSWIKVRDPQVADLFYKALVRRCPKTAIGAEADRLRWFPVLDENGTIIPRTPPPPMQRYCANALPAKPRPRPSRTVACR